MRYLEPNFTQELINRQEEMDGFLKAYLEEVAGELRSIPGEKALLGVQPDLGPRDTLASSQAKETGSDYKEPSTQEFQERPGIDVARAPDALKVAQAQKHIHEHIDRLVTREEKMRRRIALLKNREEQLRTLLKSWDQQIGTPDNPSEKNGGATQE